MVFVSRLLFFCFLLITFQTQPRNPGQSPASPSSPLPPALSLSLSVWWVSGFFPEMEPFTSRCLFVLRVKTLCSCGGRVCLTVFPFEQKECESDSSGAGRRFCMTSLESSSLILPLQLARSLLSFCSPPVAQMITACFQKQGHEAHRQPLFDF